MNYGDTYVRRVADSVVMRYMSSPGFVEGRLSVDQAATTFESASDCP